MKKRPLGIKEYTVIKQALADNGGLVEGVSRKFHRSWTTVSRIKHSRDFNEFQFGGKVFQTALAPTLEKELPPSLKEQLQAKQAAMNAHFNAVIEYLDTRR